jgi:hypothetical protein
MQYKKFSSKIFEALEIHQFLKIYQKISIGDYEPKMSQAHLAHF